MNRDDLALAYERHQETPGGACPSCASRIDAASCPSDPGARPQAGDITVCAYCGKILTCAAVDPYTLQVMPDAEVAALPEDVLLALLDAIEGARLLHGAFQEYQRIHPVEPRT